MLGTLIVFAVLAIIWGIPLLHLRGQGLSAYDIPLEASMSSDPPSEANAEMLKSHLKTAHLKAKKGRAAEDLNTAIGGLNNVIWFAVDLVESYKTQLRERE